MARFHLDAAGDVDPCAVAARVLVGTRPRPFSLPTRPAKMIGTPGSKPTRSQGASYPCRHEAPTYKGVVISSARGKQPRRQSSTYLRIRAAIDAMPCTAKAGISGRVSHGRGSWSVSCHWRVPKPRKTSSLTSCSRTGFTITATHSACRRARRIDSTGDTLWRARVEVHADAGVSAEFAAARRRSRQW